MKRTYIVTLILVLAVSLGWLWTQSKNSDPLVASAKLAIVETISGKLQGFVHNGTYIYRGVPYAKAERFMPPAKVPKWEGVRTALTYGHVSPQVVSSKIDDIMEFAGPHFYWLQGDDCQNLNVWTPAINDGRKRPVMVWFHGGGFSTGSSVEMPVYDGENLSKRGDVVVVTVNHRLNVVGFLDLSAYGEKYKYSGNLGIMDLVAALEWVRDNIANFGGDPGNVTIFGQSGGGGKVSTLMAAPAAKGLFHKAIIESGASRRRTAEQKSTRRIAEFTLQNLGLDKAQADQLQTIPYDRLVAANDKALKQISEELGEKGMFGMGMMLSPVMDNDYIPVHPFYTEAPAQSKNIPLMIGSTLNEFGAQPSSDPKLKGSPDWSLDEWRAYFKGKYGDKSDALVAAYQKAYPDLAPSDWLKVDSIFRSGSIAVAQLKADQNGAPVYMWLFTWKTPIMDGYLKASHCAEIPFVFDNIALAEQVTGGGKAAYALAEKVSLAWINFARYGNPNHKNLPDWPAYTRANGATMIFDNTSVVRNNHDKELMSLLVPDMKF
jgi:para-nitrobenzyl esterase